MNGRFRAHARRTLRITVTAVLLAVGAQAAQAGQEFNYKMILKHGIVGTKQMGTQSIKVTPVDGQPGSFDVDTRMKIDFKPFIFKHVQVDQVTKEVWRNGQIVGFESNTEDRGDKFHIKVTRDGDVLVIASDKETKKMSGMAVPTSYWYEPFFKERKEFFDIKTGEPKNMQLEFVQTANAKYRGGEHPVRHYRLAGDPKKREFWYFDSGVMFMTRWEPEGGATVTYILQ